MSDPYALSAWQLTIMAIVPSVLLAGWLITMFIAARPPRTHNVAATRPAVGAGAGGQGPAYQDEPTHVDRRHAV